VSLVYRSHAESQERHGDYVEILDGEKHDSGHKHDDDDQVDPAHGSLVLRIETAHRGRRTDHLNEHVAAYCATAAALAWGYAGRRNALTVGLLLTVYAGAGGLGAWIGVGLVGLHRRAVEAAAPPGPR